MPELPEVETIKESLKAKILFKKIKEARVGCPGLIKYPEPTGFLKQIKQKKVKGIERRGKYLVIQLTGSYFLIVHLGMTGQLFFPGHTIVLDKHTHLVLEFEDQSYLQYNDIRKFGGIWLVPEGCTSFLSGFSQLGPEPLGEEFTLGYFQSLFKKKTVIKHLLLDQRNLAGLGNIYVDEVLFRVGIHPEKRVDSFREGEIKKLYQGIQEILREAISSRGTSVVNYLDGEGKKGEFQDCLKVYRRRGDPCFQCGTPVARVVLAGRGTYYCPRCQT